MALKRIKELLNKFKTFIKQHVLLRKTGNIRSENPDSIEESSGYTKKKKIDKPYIYALLMHFGVMGLVAIVFLVSFFGIFLPIYTKHGTSVKVEDYRGLQIEVAKDFINKKGLRYSIKKEKNYSSKLLPNSVLTQDPMPYTNVKKNRRIYLTINPESPPLIKAPNLVHSTLRGAMIIIKNNGFELGEVVYKADIAKNAVLKQYYQKKELLEGDMIPEGSKIDIVVGAGLGKKYIKVPDLINKNIKSAEQILEAKGFQIGAVINKYKNGNFNYNSTRPTKNNQKTNTDELAAHEPDIVIVKQYPEPNSKARKGIMVTLWLDEKNDIEVSSGEEKYEEI